MRFTKQNLKLILQKNNISSKGNKLQLIKKYSKLIALKNKKKMDVQIENPTKILCLQSKLHKIPMDTSDDNFVRIMDTSEDD